MVRPAANREERWLLLGALVPLVLAILLHTTLSALTERDLVHRSLEAQAETLALLSARLATAAIEFDDARSVDELLEHASHTPNFDFGMVLRADHTLLAYRGDAAARELRVRDFADMPLNQPVSRQGSLCFVAAVGQPTHRLVIGLRTGAADLTVVKHVARGGLLGLVTVLIAAQVVVRLVRGVSRRRRGLERQREILREAGDLVRVGSWELELPAAELQLSAEATTVLGETSADFLRPIVSRLAFAGGDESFELEVELPSARWVRVQGRRESMEGRVTRVFGALQDITDDRAAREQALSASRAKSQFLANTSHELRTPLNGIMGLAELALSAGDALEQRQYLQGVLRSAETMLAIVNDLLDLARIESGKLKLESVTFSLDELLVAATRALSGRAASGGLDLVLSIAPNVVLQRIGDPLRLTQVVTNLLGNAIKFTERGEIEVRLEQGPDEQLQLSVRDTGIGIPPDRLDAIFGAFTQADGSTTRKYGGTGLGLTITRELVTLMGGEVSVESTPGVGSTFRVALCLPTVAGAPERKVESPAVLVMMQSKLAAKVVTEHLARLGVDSVVVADPEGARAALAARTRFGLCLVGPELVATADLQFLKAAHVDVVGLVPFGAAPLQACRSLVSPVSLRELRELLAPSAVAASPPPSKRPRERLCILLAEDNSINATVARGLLQRLGHEVCHARDGLEAVALAASGRFDLVLMDLQMPYLDGLEATRRIRASEMTSRLPIVALTANAAHSDEAECLSAGMNGFLTKPLDSHALDRLLQQFHPRRRAA